MMDTTKEKVKHQLTIALSKVEKIDPDITDKYYVKEIYMKMPVEKISRMHIPLEIIFFISLIGGLVYGVVCANRPI